MMLMGKEENKIEVSWDPQNEFLYRLRLQVIARNSMTSVSDITRGLATAEANIIHAHIKRKGALTFQTYQIELSNRHHLNKIFRELRAIKGVKKMSRENIFEEEFDA